MDDDVFNLDKEKRELAEDREAVHDLFEELVARHKLLSLKLERAHLGWALALQGREQARVEVQERVISHAKKIHGRLMKRHLDVTMSMLLAINSGDYGLATKIGEHALVSDEDYPGEDALTAWDRNTRPPR